MTDDPNLPAIATAEVSKVWAGQLGRYFDSLFGPASREFGDYLALDVRKWRAMKLLKHAEWLEKIMTERGLSPDQVRHLGYAEVVPLIEAASYEESDEVHELWAKLLASALDPKSGVKIEKAFIGILKEIGPIEARVMAFVDKWSGFGRVDGDDAKRCFSDHHKLLGGLSSDALGAALLNLRRLCCLRPVVDEALVEYTLSRHSWELMDGSTRPVLEDLFNDILYEISKGPWSEELPRGDILALESGEIRLPATGLLLTGLGERLMDAIENRPEDPEAAPSEAT